MVNEVKRDSVLVRNCDIVHMYINSNILHLIMKIYAKEDDTRNYRYLPQE